MHRYRSASETSYQVMIHLLVGLVVLSQVPTARDLAGVGLVIAGVALHQEVSQGRRRLRRR